MILKIKTPPVIEPVDLDELKNHLRLDTALEDTTLSSYLKAARQHVENLCGPLITQTWYQYADGWPCSNAIIIGKPHLRSVTAITYTDTDSDTTTWTSTYYAVDDENEYFPRVVLEYGETWPGTTLHPNNPICIEFICGYGDDAEDVPEPIRIAVMMLAAHFYENREPVNISTGTVTALPFAVDALLSNYRHWGMK